MSDKIIPYHVAIVMDGNGRWAKQRGLTRTFGHRAGVKAVKNLLTSAGKAGIKIITLFAFSSENWQRSDDEVNQLMKLFFNALSRDVKKLNEKGVRLRFIGERARLDATLQKKMQDAETLTAKNQVLQLVIAINYGGQWDILQATQHLANEVQQGKLKAEDINVENFSQALCTQELPPPDLFIRTSGELRISNFLLWQLAYTELYFTDLLWPDFDEQALQEAIAAYQKRQRRYGKA